MFGGRGMGGGGVALRSVGRAVTRVGIGGGGGGAVGGSGGAGGVAGGGGINGSSSSSRRTSPRRTHLSMASPVSSDSSYNQKSGTSGIPFWYSGSAECDECEWVAVDGIEDECACGYGFDGHFVLGHVPSEDEVEDAVSALQHVFGSSSPVQHVREKYNYESDGHGSELDWVEPSLTPYKSRILQAKGSEGVYHAFHLLQTDPSVQRMVKSLSSDKAVWDAIMNNEAVRDLRESIFEDEENSSRSSGDISEVESHTTTNIVIQIFHTAKAKFMEVIQKITMIMNELFQPANQKTASEEEPFYRDCVDEIVKFGFMLSVVVMLVVVGGRRAKTKRETLAKSSKV